MSSKTTKPNPNQKLIVRLKDPKRFLIPWQKQQIIIGDGPGLVEEDSNEFGLTRRDYVFLQWDIENEIARFDEEHGFDGTGYHDRDNSYVYSIDKVKTLDEKRRKKVSAQNVAIAKGIIKIKKMEAEN